MAHKTLLLGGIRSGKSAHAEALIRRDAPTGRAIYLATGRRDPADAEWQARINAHVARRPAGWRTIETADPIALIAEATPADPPLLLEDVSGWLVGVLDQTDGWSGDLDACGSRCRAMVSAVEACRARLVLVSAEVGLGVVPATRSGRLFADELGALNAELAGVCDEVTLVVAGLPMRVK